MTIVKSSAKAVQTLFGKVWLKISALGASSRWCNSMSIIRLNKIGESGHPCFTPLLIGIFRLSFVLKVVTTCILWIRFVTALINQVGAPISKRRCRRNS